MATSYAFILGIFVSVLIGLAFYYYKDVYKRRVLTNQLLGTDSGTEKKYEYKSLPEKYTNYELKGNVKKYEWKLQEVFNRENDRYTENKHFDYIKFSADLSKNPNTIFIHKKTKVITKPELFDHIQTVFFDGKILNPDVDAQVKEMNIVPCGSTGAFIKNFYVFAKNKHSVKRVLTELVEDVIVHDFNWCKEDSFQVMILKDKLVIKTHTSINSGEIKSIIRLGEKILDYI